jgi:hypothetical protein
MNLVDIKMEMQLGGVANEDIKAILELCKTEGYKPEFMDNELIKRGYDRIFTVDYDDYDDFDDWEDEFSAIEPFPHRKRYKE